MYWNYRRKYLGSQTVSFLERVSLFGTRVSCPVWSSPYFRGVECYGLM